MKLLGRVVILAIFLIASNSVLAEQVGEAAARAGTLIHNEANPNKPLPVPNGGGESLIKGTLQNMGNGMSAKKAYQKSSENVSGVKSTSPQSSSSGSAVSR